MRLERDERGGLVRRRVVDSAVRGIGVVRSGGRRSKRSSSSGGSSDDASGRDTARGLRVAGFVDSGG
jgi:hypothetical protein